MSDTAQTPEAVAYKLLEVIGRNEGKNSARSGFILTADKEWILQTYTECLLAVQKPIARIKS